MSVTVSDEDWMQRLWEWADRYKISKKTLPRKESKLLKMKHLELKIVNFGLNKIQADQWPKEMISSLPEEERKSFLKLIIKIGNFPEELGRLVQLEKLSINYNNIERLPDSIVNLKNIKSLSLRCNKNLVLTVEQKMWIWELESNGAIVEYDERLGA